ncbi:MAG: NAD(P)-dependent alcohol dehydrogenase [Gluconacetobacter diazotrophicus]|nr:NAD(P)-dependent alcohol dehydrogenase [Gluconacetobacter diazotrophicus]
MKALVLERKGELAIRDIPLPDELGPQDVRIRLHTVGVCGSDVHYYTHGAIGSFVVEEPMVLGHEASGTVDAVGSAVRTLKVGDRVCMEPGIPDFQSRATLMGKYNIDPAVRFWATPPVHGCLTGTIVHPAALTFRIPDNVTFAEAAMVEPFAVGVQAAVKARITPGDVAVVTGAGTIGMMIALAALAGGCSQVFITDVHQPKLDIAGRYPGIIPINIRERDPGEAVREATGGWGANLVFEASGSPAAIAAIAGYAAPGGGIVVVGMPTAAHSLDINTAMAKELRVEFVFRYANVFPRALAMIASGKVDLKPLISATFPFERSIEAFERAARGEPTDVKLQIAM